MSKVGDYLKKARSGQDLSLKDVYKKTGITDSRLSRIENGCKPFEATPEEMKALARLYKIGLVEFLLDTGYLDTGALSAYERVFRNVELLSDEERRLIQEQIDLFTKGRKTE